MAEGDDPGSEIEDWEMELVKPSHPIWKILIGLVAVLSMAWGIESGQI